MKKFDFRKLRKIKFRKVTVDQLSDKMLLVNLYMTQALTVIIGIIVLLLQGRNIINLFALPRTWEFALWGGGLAGAVMLANLAMAKFVPEEAADDGGVNERMFKGRPIWHIAVLALIISVCEELLFRGALQHMFGAYWTSILFAAIHVRYLRHWIPTGLVFLISYGLGWTMTHTGTIWTPILAHFLIDFVMGCIIRLRRDEA
ncbi:CPBP family intramembrane glutamic endopeptidase [Cohnella sp. GCM10027633]|uniref:CPBP family intramembrane glutamic endopeptidase n=1 Tax=unclassified Cohnella TaxID=2636738 RepID=UPI003636C9FD